MADDNMDLIKKMLALGVGGAALGAGGGDASGNASNYLPNITNPAPTYDLGTGRNAPMITGSGVQMPEDTSTTPPPPIQGTTPINIAGMPDINRYLGEEAATATPPVTQIAGAPDINRYLTENAADTQAAQQAAAQAQVPAIAPGAPIQTGNAYRPEGVFGPTGPGRNIGGVGTQIADSSGVGLPNIGPGGAAIVQGPQTDQQKFEEIRSHTYNPAVYRLSDKAGTLTSDMKKVKADPNAVLVTPAGAQRKKNWSTWDKIGNALLGWAQGGIVGGVKGATDRNFFRKMQDQQQMAELLPRIQAQQAIAYKNAQTQNQQAQTKYQSDRLRAQAKSAMDVAEVKARADTNKSIERTDEATGQVYRHYNNADIPDKKLYDEDGNPVINPRYGWYDPISKQTIPLSGEKYATAQGPVITGQYAREQSTEEKNAKAIYDAKADFAKRQDDYNKIAFTANSDKVKALANTTMYGQAATDAAKQLWLIQERLDMYANTPLSPDAKEDQITQRNSEIEKLHQEYRAAGDKMNEAMRQSQAGKDFISQGGLALPPPPKYVEPVLIKAVQAAGGGGKPVGTYSQDDFVKAAKAKGITGKALETAITTAKRDGVIKQ